jgi:hypothetical protein
MSTSIAAHMPDTLNPSSDEIKCPYCRGRGKFTRREVVASLGIQDDVLTQQVWSLEEVAMVLELRSRRERQRSV